MSRSPRSRTASERCSAANSLPGLSRAQPPLDRWVRTACADRWSCLWAFEVGRGEGGPCGSPAACGERPKVKLILIKVPLSEGPRAALAPPLGQLGDWPRGGWLEHVSVAAPTG